MRSDLQLLRLVRNSFIQKHRKKTSDGFAVGRDFGTQIFH